MKPLKEIAGYRTRANDSVRAALESSKQPLAHTSTPPVCLGNQDNRDDRQQEDAGDDGQYADEMRPHQNASPMERCKVIRSRTPLKPDLTGWYSRR